MFEEIEVNGSVESDRSSTQSLEDGFKLLVLLSTLTLVTLHLTCSQQMLNTT